ncbi:MAG: hypothetical protein RIS20_910 [Bacteroidota bacterium]|jgi:hypothetical protein
MKDFFRRLKYYGLGFGIGLIMVMALFDNKGCSWFPSNRVKDNLFSRMIVANASSFDEIKEQGFTQAGFLKTVQAGTVDFGKSKKQGLDKVYRIDYETPKGKKVHCFMTMGDESFMTEIIFSNKKATQIAPTNSDAELPGKILFFPKNEFLFYMDSSSVLTEKMKSLGIKNDKELNRLIRKNGLFNFSRSYLLQHPKPVHCLQFNVSQTSKETIFVKCIWYKDKIKVYDLSTHTLDF